METAFVGDSASFVEFHGPTRGELWRIGRYNQLVRDLSRGRIAGPEFQRRVRSWKPIAGERFASDPNAVLARLEELKAEDREVFEYRSGRAA
jgi:hypothetical protein